MGIASLVLGIIAVIIGLFSAGSLGWAGAIMAIIGIILGERNRKKAVLQLREWYYRSLDWCYA